MPCVTNLEFKLFLAAWVPELRGYDVYFCAELVNTLFSNCQQGCARGKLANEPLILTMSVLFSFMCVAYDKKGTA